jgi:hypothetical protein
MITDGKRFKPASAAAPRCRRAARWLPLLCFSSALGCSTTPDVPRDTGGADMAVTPDASAAPRMVTQRQAQVTLSWTGSTLNVAVTDGKNPIMTDVWLYSLQGTSVQPITSFTSPATKRRSPARMMPCFLSGQPSGLWPCDIGEQNGVMTDTVHATLAGGVYSANIHGQVAVPLPALPQTPVMVVVGIEDQRFTGAAAIDPAGNAVAVPAGYGVPGSHRVRTYGDVAPILKANCVSCHKASSGVGDAPLFPMDSYDNLVNNNTAYAEGKQSCIEKNPTDMAAQQACIAAITRVQYLVEPGAPANSNLLMHARPDENRSVSPTGLLWYGARGSRVTQSGDRRMPPQTLDAPPDMGTVDPQPTYFDLHPEEYQILFDWVAQGAPQ